jgi:hypothetical protein
MPGCNLLLVVGFVSLANAFASQAEEPIKLNGWNDDPITVPRTGAGIELFRLWADVTWNRATASKAGRLALRIVGPAGQVTTQRIDPGDVDSGRRLAVYVPTSWVRNLRPESVAIEVSVVEAATDRVVAGPLRGGVDAFPMPKTSSPPPDPGPFGWGRPLDGPGEAGRVMERSGPDGWTFVRIPAAKGRPGFFLATTEATIRQIRLRVPSYDPRAGRSDDFLLEEPDQPAIGLTPLVCRDYLDKLHVADPDGPTYRLPTRSEWLLAARAGKDTPFWWGSAPTDPGANLLGDEPALKGDATAPARPSGAKAAFRPNPWGLFHTFGNVEEWTTNPGGGFVRLGGHFRTEPETSLSETKVDDPRTIGPDPFVGLRPAFDLRADEAESRIRKAFASDPRLSGVKVKFDPDRATATLDGIASEPSDRRLADAKVGMLWWVAAVENRIETPRLAPGQLARLGDVCGPARRLEPLGRTHYEIPVAVKWADRLPVAGSEWWVNIYVPGGGHDAHRLIEGEPDGSGRVTLMIDRARMLAAGLATDTPVSVALSLGTAAATADDPKVVSNVAVIRWKIR